MHKNERDQHLELLIRQGLSKKINRRNFIKTAMATGITLSASTGLWTNSVHAATPKKGGVFRVGVHDGNTTDSFDPGTTESVYMIQMNHIMRSFLTEITNTNELGPDIAQSWEATPDATEWRFKLNSGITFHSGKKLTTADVIASLNHHRGEDTKSAAKALLTDVDDIKSEGDDVVVIKLKSGNADLPYLLSDYHLVILPSDESGKIDWQSMDGTGPYKVLNHEPGVSTKLERFDGWFREGAYFDGLHLISLSDPSARSTAILTGEVDALTEVESKTVSRMSKVKHVSIDNVPSAAHVTLPMFCDQEPFNNVDVRNALKLSIDREEIKQKIFYGNASIGNDTPIGPSLPYYHEMEQRPYDPDQAKSLLKKAGVKDLQVSLSAADSAFAGAVDLCLLYKESAAKAGININVVREPNDGYWSNVWLKKPFVTVGWGARPTPDVMFSLAYKHDAEWNESHWQNKRFNELLSLAKAELDDAKRSEMYAEMQILCRDDGGTVMPIFRNRVMARSNKVMHEENIASNWELDGARAYQRWWFDG